MRHFKNFVLGALTFGFFLGLGFSRGLLLQEDKVRINLDLPALIIAVDDDSFFSSTSVLEIEKYFARRVEVRKVGDSADLSPQLAGQNPPHIILSSLVNLISFANGEFAEINPAIRTKVHPDFTLESTINPRRDVLVAFWGYGVLESDKILSLKTFFDKKMALQLNLDKHSQCNWKMKLSEEFKLPKEVLAQTTLSQSTPENVIIAHTNSKASNLPIEGTILWKKALAIPQNSPDLDLSRKVLDILVSQSFYLGWLNKLPAAGTLNFVEGSNLQVNKKPSWLRQIDLNRFQKDKICPPEWRQD